MFTSLERELPTIGPETVAKIGNFPIANSTLMILLIAVIIVIFYFVVARRFKNSPGKGQGFLELMYEAMVSFIDQITGNKRRTNILEYTIATVFIFIGISNLISFIPGITSFTVGHVPMFRAPTADFNTTFTLALVGLLVIQYISIKEWGIFAYAGKYFKFKELYHGFRKGLKPGVSALIEFGIGLLDIIGDAAKIISLSLRLFGNIFAGEVLAVIILGSLAWAAPAVWTSFGVLVGVIQAMVFGALLSAYYMLAIKPDEVK